MASIEEIRKKFGLDSRVGKVRCKKCGKEMEVPNMYGSEERALLEPFCCSTVVLHVQWLIHHGWHVAKHEATPSGAFLCEECYTPGIPEYTKSPYCEKWCEQAEAWMRDNNGRR